MKKTIFLPSEIQLLKLYLPITKQFSCSYINNAEFTKVNEHFVSGA
jgi:hypothetical protein